MIFLIIGFLFGVIATVYFFQDNFFSWEEVFILAPLFGIIFVSIGSFIGIWIALFIGLFMPKTWALVETRDLVAISDNQGIQGQSFLFHGYINDVEKYAFYYRTGEGSYRQDSIRADGVDVVETHGEAKLEVFKKRFKHDWMLLIAQMSESFGHKVFVPKGTIVRQMEMDLQ